MLRCRTQSHSNLWPPATGHDNNERHEQRPQLPPSSTSPHAPNTPAQCAEAAATAACVIYLSFDSSASVLLFFRVQLAGTCPNHHCAQWAGSRARHTHQQRQPGRPAQHADTHTHTHNIQTPFSYTASSIPPTATPTHLPSHHVASCRRACTAEHRAVIKRAPWSYLWDRTVGATL
jgi:hypothetical protein